MCLVVATGFSLVPECDNAFVFQSALRAVTAFSLHYAIVHSNRCVVLTECLLELCSSIIGSNPLAVALCSMETDSVIRFNRLCPPASRFQAICVYATFVCLYHNKSSCLLLSRNIFCFHFWVLFFNDRQCKTVS